MPPVISQSYISMTFLGLTLKYQRLEVVELASLHSTVIDICLKMYVYIKMMLFVSIYEASEKCRASEKYLFFM